MNVDSPQEIGVGHPNTGTYQKLPLLADERIVHVSCGYHHSAAVSSRGVLYSWGRDSEGCLGHGVEEMNAGEWSNDMRSTFLPSAVRSFLQQEKKTMRVRVRIENVSCGSEHSLAVDNEGSIWSWGKGAFGALGHGDTKSLSLPKKIASAFKSTDRIVNAVAGAKHSIAISQGNGDLFSWGMGDQGRLGNGSEVGSLVPLKVNLSHVEDGDEMCMYVATGEAHSAICTVNGHVYTWGKGWLEGGGAWVTATTLFGWWQGWMCGFVLSLTEVFHFYVHLFVLFVFVSLFFLASFRRGFARTTGARQRRERVQTSQSKHGARKMHDESRMWYVSHVDVDQMHGPKWWGIVRVWRFVRRSFGPR